MRTFFEFSQKFFITKPILSFCESSPVCYKINVLSIIKLSNNFILWLIQLYLKPLYDFLDLLIEYLRIFHWLSK